MDFKIDEKDLQSIVDLIIAMQMKDGAFNCRLNRSGAVHSSMHTTISVIEGIIEYSQQGYTYRLKELLKIEKEAREFLLQHQLFRSDRTGEIINPNWLKLSYPSRWKYDILRALDHFQNTGAEYDPRLQEALDILKEKQRKDHKWPHQNKHPGQVHFDMETARQPSRWNTLRALRVLKHFEQINY